MRIALLSHEYPDETGFGGIGTYTWFHARALAKLGHDVHVLAGATRASTLRAEPHDGVQVWRTMRGGLPESMYRSLGRMRLWWTRERARNAVDMWWAFRQLHRRHPFDVVEAPECGAEGLLVSRFTDVPTVVRLHSPARLIMPFYDVASSDQRWCARLEEAALRSATAVSSSSQFLASQLPALGISRSAEVIHNGIDLDHFDRAELDQDPRERFGIPRGKPIVLFVGRLEPRKGIHLCGPVVAEVLRRHDCAFVFAGADLFGHMESDVRPGLKDQALRGSLHGLGRLGQRDVRSLVNAADIVFLPSLWESCPYSCLEAMAARRTIVASDAGGLPELLAHRRNAFVVRSGDVDGFIAAIGELLEDASLRAELGGNARRTIEAGFKDTDVAQRSLGVYEGARR